jgi:hypothetical protein
MRGDDVRHIQRRLRDRNKWEKDFSPGKIDGQYGPYTAAAVMRAKHFLGYPKKDINKSAGPTLDAYLEGRAPLPKSYQWRMKRRRQQAAARNTLRAKALRSAMKKKGLTESPQGSNRNFLTRWWYGNETSAPWCAISASHSYIQAGSKAFKKGRDFAYVPFMENAAANGTLGLARVTKDNVKPGDIVTFDFDGGVADHVGIFVKWVSKRDGTFEAIEGNTDAAGGAEGGEQMLRVRTVRQVSQFIRVLK